MSITEFIHYSSVLCGPQLRNKVNYEKGRESQVRALPLEILEVQSDLDVTCKLPVNRFLSMFHITLPDPM
jgi:hypothetical protein